MIQINYHSMLQKYWAEQTYRFRRSQLCGSKVQKSDLYVWLLRVLYEHYMLVVFPGGYVTLQTHYYNLDTLCLIGLKLSKN